MSGIGFVGIGWTGGGTRRRNRAVGVRWSCGPRWRKEWSAKAELLDVGVERELTRSVARLVAVERLRESMRIGLRREPSLAEIANASRLDSGEILGYLENGQRAKHRLVEANLRLVSSIACRYMGRGVSLQDLVQEGACGLMHATEKYDESKGARFSSYATFWIRQYIQQSVANDSRCIRLPRSFLEKLTVLKSAYKSIFDQYGRIASMDELRQETGFSEELIQQLVKSSQNVQSLDKAYDDEGEAAPIAKVEWEGDGPETAAARTMLTEGIHQVLNTLSERERGVIRLRYGLGAEKETRASEVARMYALSAAGIRKIELRALKKLRIHSDSLQEYLSDV